MDTRELITQYYVRTNRADWAAFVDLFAVDFVMDEQMVGHLEGREALRDVMSHFPEWYASFQNVPRRIVVDGDEGVALTHLSAVKPTGASIDAEVSYYFRTSGGQITYMSSIHDTMPWRDAGHVQTGTLVQETS
ncbi:nuclear transport factor 2 family protein [Streptomyces sp. NPDC050145]|uniref:nuclear transport factor 2 family protein n=1 Tax=Streptomyces sp. NPDC050145 TaxID=3365602 RepID=UPI0037AEA035